MSNNQSNINQTAQAAGSTPPPVVATPGLGADGLAPSSTVSVPNSTTAPATQSVATNVPSVNNSESQGTNTAGDTSGAPSQPPTSVPARNGGNSGTPNAPNVAETAQPRALTVVERLKALGAVKRATGKVNSAYFENIKLLEQFDQRRLTEVKGKNCTHYCTFCDEALVLTWKAKDKGRAGGHYISTQAQRHLISCEEGGKEKYGDACKKNEKNRVQKREFEKTGNMEQYHNTLAVDNAKKLKKEDKPKRYTQGKLPGAMSYQDKALCAQAHWFMYSSTVQSFEVFRSEEFKDMLQAMIPKNESKLKAPILDIKHLKEYINAEWVVFKKNLRKTINPHLEEAKGNSF